MAGVLFWSTVDADNKVQQPSTAEVTTFVLRVVVMDEGGVRKECVINK